MECSVCHSDSPSLSIYTAPLSLHLQIKALVQCGKLKNAYLTAIKSRLVDEVVNISQIAEKAGQLPVRDICEKWLQANGIPRRT